MKTVFMVLFFMSVSLNIYFLSNSEKTELISDEVSTNQSALKKELVLTKKNQAPVKKVVINSKKNIHEDCSVSSDEFYGETIDKIKKEDKVSFDDYSYDEMKRVWESKLKDFLEVDLSLEIEQINAYFDIRVEYDKAMDEYFKHLDNQQKDGETYILEAQEQLETAKLKIKYLDRLKGLWGQDNFDKYKSFLNRYNNGLMNDEHNQNNIIVDF